MDCERAFFIIYMGRAVGVTHSVCVCVCVCVALVIQHTKGMCRFVTRDLLRSAINISHSKKN